MTNLFQALNDETRRSILDLLREGDLSAGAIAEHFRLGKPTVSHHLDLLKRAGLVTAEKQGQYVIYSLTTSVLEDAVKWILTLTGRSAASSKVESPAKERASAIKTKTKPTAHEKPAEKKLAAGARARRASGIPRRGLA